jgi:hypothetical protein
LVQEADLGQRRRPVAAQRERPHARIDEDPQERPRPRL